MPQKLGWVPARRCIRNAAWMGSLLMTSCASWKLHTSSVACSTHTSHAAHSSQQQEKPEDAASSGRVWLERTATV